MYIFLITPIFATAVMHYLETPKNENTGTQITRI